MTTMTSTCPAWCTLHDGPALEADHVDHVSAPLGHVPAFVIPADETQVADVHRAVDETGALLAEIRLPGGWLRLDAAGRSRLRAALDAVETDR